MPARCSYLLGIVAMSGLLLAEGTSLAELNKGERVVFLGLGNSCVSESI